MNFRAFERFKWILGGGGEISKNAICYGKRRMGSNHGEGSMQGPGRGIHNQRRRIKELGEEYGKDITKETEGKNPNKRRWRIKLGELLLFPPSVLTPPLHLLVGKRTQRFRLLDGSRRFFNHLYLLLNNSMGRQGEVGSDSQRFQQIVQ